MATDSWPASRANALHSTTRFLLGASSLHHSVDQRPRLDRADRTGQVGAGPDRRLRSRRQRPSLATSSRRSRAKAAEADPAWGRRRAGGAALESR